MNRTLYLLCGVPGSGKTWVMNRSRELFNTVDHDDHIGAGSNLVEAVCLAALTEKTKPLLVDCPFGERELRAKLEKSGFIVKPIFIIEATPVVQTRYFEREGKPLSRSSITRSITIMQRANEWDAPRGTSEQVLEYLKKEAA